MKRHIAIISLQLVLFYSFSQTYIPEYYFAKSYSVSANSYGGNIFQLADKGFICSATNIDTVIDPITTFTNYIEVLAIQRTNAQGNTIWAKNYNLNSNCAYGGGFILTKDSGYAFLSVYTNSTGTNPDHLLFKTDKNGNVLWNHRYGALGNEYAVSLLQDTSENYYLAGYSDSHAPGKGDFNIIKTTKTGAPVWSSTYGIDTTYEFPIGMLKDKNQDLLLYGIGNKYINDSTIIPTIEILKTDNGGNIKYFKRLFVNGDWKVNGIYLYNATVMSDKSLLLLSSHTKYTNLTTYNSVENFLITKIDSMGNIVWNNEYSTPPDTSYYFFPTVLQETKNNEFVVMGQRSSYTGMTDTTFSFYMEFDQVGNLKRAIKYPPSFPFYGLAMNSTSGNTGKVVLGIDFKKYQNAIVKMDTLGQFGNCFTFPQFNLQKDPFNFSTESGGYRLSIGTDNTGLVTVTSVLAPDTVYCSRKDSILYIEPPKPPRTVFIDVPSAFSPNGDGINDVIYAAGFGIKKINYFRIYNRWGQILFETQDLMIGWDGSYKGSPQNMETYVYQLSAELNNDDKVVRSGAIKLIR